jgi:vacuolar-type H+-ATPase subunit D/Vma8
MSNVQMKLRMILEGDVVGFNSHPMRIKKKEEELIRVKSEMNNLIDGIAQSIAALTRLKDSGKMSQEAWLKKMNELEPRRLMMLDYNKRIQALESEIEELKRSSL